MFGQCRRDNSGHGLPRVATSLCDELLCSCMQCAVHSVRASKQWVGMIPEVRL